MNYVHCWQEMVESTSTAHGIHIVDNNLRTFHLHLLESLRLTLVGFGNQFCFSLSIIQNAICMVK